jgi:hypothetical protein
LFIYGIYRIARKEDCALDRELLLAFVVMNLVGPLQQILLLLFWRTTGFNALSGIIYELARFEVFAFLPFYLLLGQVIKEFTGYIVKPGIRILVITLFCILLYLNLGYQVTIFLPLRFEQILLLTYVLLLVHFKFLYMTSHAALLGSRLTKASYIMAVGMIGIGLISSLWFYALKISTDKPIFLVMACAGLIALGYVQAFNRLRFAMTTAFSIVIVLTLVRVLPRYPVLNLSRNFVQLRSALGHPPSESEAYKTDQAFFEVTTWLKENTPKSSLLHSISFESSFRYFTERSLLIGYMDNTIAIYSGKLPIEIDQLYQEAQRAFTSPTQFSCFVGQNRVDYVISEGDITYADCTSQETRYTLKQVYKNDFYTVYKLTTSELDFI